MRRLGRCVVSTSLCQARDESPPRLSHQTLCRAGWRASYEDLQDVDHFEMVWKLTQQDFELTQVGRVPSRVGGGGCVAPAPAVAPTCEGSGERRAAAGGLSPRRLGDPAIGIECHTCLLPLIFFSFFF